MLGKEPANSITNMLQEHYDSRMWFPLPRQQDLKHMGQDVATKVLGIMSEH